MTREQFIIKCNLKGIKIERHKNDLRWNGRPQDLYIVKAEEWEASIYIDQDFMETDPRRAYDQLWQMIEKYIKEARRNRKNPLWENAVGRVMREDRE